MVTMVSNMHLWQTRWNLFFFSAFYLGPITPIITISFLGPIHFFWHGPWFDWKGSIIFVTSWCLRKGVISNIFYFHPYSGKWSNLTKIFQMGWNHHLVKDEGFFLEKLNWLSPDQKRDRFSCNFLTFCRLMLPCQESDVGLAAWDAAFQESFLVRGWK